MTTPPLPPALAAAARRARAVRPLLAPGWRAAAAAAFGLAIVAAVLARAGVRHDAPALGAALWAAAALRVAAGAFFLWLAMREASPAQGLPRSVRRAASIAVPALLVLLAERVSARGSMPPFDPGPLRCFPEAIVFSLPALVLVGVLLARAYPLRPTVALTGGFLGAALITDAMMHIACPASSFAHTVGVHGGAVATAVLFAAIGGWFAGRRRAARLD